MHAPTIAASEARVMEDADWGLSGNVAWLKDKAWHQLGTSGSGNHFLDAGILTPVSDEAAAILGIEPGREHFAELASRCSRALRRCGRANPPRAPLPSGTR